MKLSILRRSTLSKYYIAYLFGVFYFTFVFYCQSNSISLNSLNSLVAYISENRLITALFLLASVFSFKIKKQSQILSFAYLLHTAITIAIWMHSDFDKINLTLFFTYISTAFIIFITNSRELDAPYYEPNLDKNSLYDGLDHLLYCYVEFDNICIKGKLSNWNEDSCFIELEMPFDWKNRKKILKVIMTSECRIFSSKAILMSTLSNHRGIGLRFADTQLDEIDFGFSYNWYNYYRILENRQFIPKFLVRT